MTISPKVSVLIPTYNYGHILHETIESVLAQTFTDFELVIVDNCSTDNTEDVVRSYMSDPRVVYYKNDKNIGLAGNWNRCLELAKGEYIKMLCADDKLHPLLLERYVPVLNENADVVMVSCQKELFGAIRRNNLEKPPFDYKQNGKDMLYQMLVHKNNFIGDPTRPMFRRSSLHVGHFKKLQYVTDWEMWNRIIVTGDCYFIPEVLAYGRIHAGQQQSYCKKLAINHIENYGLYKAVQMGEYGEFTGEQKSLIDKMVKVRAIMCAFSFYKLLPKILNKAYRKSISALLKIAFNENVLFHPNLMNIYSKKVRERNRSLYREYTSDIYKQPTIALNDADR